MLRLWPGIAVCLPVSSAAYQQHQLTILRYDVLRCTMTPIEAEQMNPQPRTVVIWLAAPLRAPGRLSLCALVAEHFAASDSPPLG
jgi:hypothetical protein